MIVLDTNVISALMRPEASAAVVEWANAQPSLWLTAISIMEIRSGLLFMPVGKRRQALTEGFDTLLAGLLKGHALPFSAEAAEEAAYVDYIQQRRGRNVGSGDIQIAGTVRANRATLATRNIKDFSDLNIVLINPWID